MAETTLCGRVGCGEPAAGVLLMAAQDREAWLVPLDHAFAPDGVGLCAVHADRITVPLGWSLADERPPAKPRRSRKRKPRTSAKDATVATDASTPAARRVSDPDEPLEQDGTRPTTPKSSAPRATGEHDAAPERPSRKAEATAETTKAASAKTEGAAKAEGAKRKLAKPATAKATRAKRKPAEAEAAVSSEAAHLDDLDEPVAATAAADHDGDDEPTVQLPAVRLDHPSSPAEVPLNADGPAAAVDDSGRRLSVVPGEDDPNKTFDFEDGGQGALWAPETEDAHEPDERTPLLKRAFRVVRDD